MTETSQPRRIHGRYLLEERISRGGSADVWRARDEQLDRPVAVKLLHPHLVPDERARLRLAAEGRLVASLDHPAIVQMYDVLVDDDTPALIMELVEGESLNLRLARDGALPVRAAAAIGAEVAEALAEAHHHGIVHRDVKPSNILLDTGGHAHLADFGIAHSLEVNAERLTQTGMVVGTPAYLSPEQLAGSEVGPRTDIFGLGAVIFEMLTGRPPYAAMAPLLLADAHAAGPPAMPDIDPALGEITRACLATNPSERPPDAGFVAATLRGFSSMNPAERDADTRAIAVIPVAGAAPAPEQGPATWWRRLPLATAATGLLAMLVLAAVMLGPGKSAADVEQDLPSSTPAPAWAMQLAADYADACGATLDPAQIDGLSQPDAEAQVSSLIDACGTAQEAAGEGGGGSGGGGNGGGGKGKGKGRD
ncbi:MAG TPA: protein kinase [Candidatus Limnocylindria bacterium]|nr:protein kinase [Candidatus Limnocylindria bacterium]